MITTLLAVADGIGHFSRFWTYITLGATGIVTEEATPVVAGFAAHQGHLGFIEAALSISLGTWWADIALYGIGRWQAGHILRKWPKLRDPMHRLLAAVRRRPWRASIAVRFAYGARLLLPLTCGGAKVPIWLYVAGSAISAFSWGFVFTAVGWGFGNAAVRLLGQIRRYELTIGVALGVGIFALVLILHLRNRNRVPEEIAGGEITGTSQLLD